MSGDAAEGCSAGVSTRAHEPEQSPAATTDPAPVDADLARLVERWPDLPEATRRAVLAVVEAALPVTSQAAKPDE